jgi:hypothetical protein
MTVVSCEVMLVMECCDALHHVRPNVFILG